MYNAYDLRTWHFDAYLGRVTHVNVSVKYGRQRWWKTNNLRQFNFKTNPAIWKKKFIDLFFKHFMIWLFVLYVFSTNKLQEIKRKIALYTHIYIHGK